MDPNDRTEWWKDKENLDVTTLFAPLDLTQVNICYAYITPILY
jgi:hypothetical protein